MALHPALKEYFKPEVQKNGEDYFKKEVVFLSVTSDTAITGFIKGAGAARVNFFSKSIADQTFFAACTCPRGLKGILCKHMWAVLLKTEQQHPDFLDSKISVEIAPAEEKPETPQKAKQAEYKEAQAERQRVYGKQQRQAQKARKKQLATGPVTYPAEVQEALDFFKVNGFSFDENTSEESLKDARKILSRVFHPDKGGTHEEALTLNNHYETLTDFLNK